MYEDDWSLKHTSNFGKYNLPRKKYPL